MSDANPLRASLRRQNAKGRGAQGSAAPQWPDANEEAQHRHAGPARVGQPTRCIWTARTLTSLAA